MSEEIRIGLRIASRTLPAIVNTLADGDVVLTRHNKPVARIVAYEPQETREAER